MACCSDLNTDDIAFAFKDISISNLIPPESYVSNVSGFIQSGCITAVFGASASGKSLLLKSLAGRIRDLSITGDVLLNGVQVQPTHPNNSVSYMSQENMLLGDLTPREMLRQSATFKLNCSKEQIEQRVQSVLDDLGLAHVADNYIGTAFRAGLSGGQQRRVDAGIELVATPSVLLMDEPTTGLDGSIAYDVLAALRNRVKNSNKQLSVALSIHQPNKRILDLFDHILVLGDNGSMSFFGTVEESIRYFTKIGFPPPAEYTPTDYYLQCTDSNFSEDDVFDFEGAFACSKQYNELERLLNHVKFLGLSRRITKDLGAEQDNQHEVDLDSTQSISATSFWTQFSVLVTRDLMLASRDPTALFLQFLLTLAFGFLIGSAFFKLKYEIGDTQGFVPGSILWIMMMMVYVNVFKVYHLFKAGQRQIHERMNQAHTVFTFWLAQMFTSGLLLLSYMPGLAIAYFMVGFPSSAFPVMMLNSWTVAFAGEAMMNLITKFFGDVSSSVVFCQLVLVVLTIFGGGLFIRWEDVPGYWSWLQGLSIFTHSTRMAMQNIMRKIAYECTLQGGVCYGSYGEVYNCQGPVSVTDTKCDVGGSTVLYVTQNVGPNENYWNSYAYLIALLVAFELAVLFLMYYPIDKIKFWLSTSFFPTKVLAKIADSESRIRFLRGQVQHLIDKDINMQEQGGYNKKAADKMDCGADEEDGDHAPLLGADGEAATAHAAPKKLTFSWRNITLKLKGNGKVLVDNVSGKVDQGKCLALMGPSGAGKTTLLNSLAGRATYADTTGDVMFGSTPMLPSDLMYVPQYDELKSHATVVQQMEYVGRMKCKDVVAMKRRLLKLLKILGLFGKANTLCKDLSGGEKKRLSVGMGMISNPNILFLDEPTSGLDSTSAYWLVKYLVCLAKTTNVAVIMTIHQPAAIVFDMLPDLYLLETGRLAYFGPIPAAKAYFDGLGYACPSGVNPADHYLNLIYKAPEGKGEGVLWRDLFGETEMGKRMTGPCVACAHQERQVGLEAPSELSRLQATILFFLGYFYQNPGYYIIRLAYLIMAGLFVGTVYLDLDTNTENLLEYSGAIFFSMWTVLFGVVGSTGLIASDRRQSFEQVKNGIITPSIFCVGQFIATIPYNLGCALIFQTIFHWLTNINPSGVSFIYGVLLSAGHLSVMEGIMYVVVEIVKDGMLSVTFAMVVLGLLFLFPGFFIQVKEMPVWIGWISYIVPTKYSFDGYLHMIFIDQDFDVQNFGTKIKGVDVLKDVFGQPKDVSAWGMFGVLILWVFFFRVVHYLLFLKASAPYLKKSASGKTTPALGTNEVSEFDTRASTPPTPKANNTNAPAATYEMVQIEAGDENA